MNRIIELTKVFLKNSFSFSNIQSAKFNIKGIIKWAIIFIAGFMGLLSYKILDILSDIGQEAVFLSILFLILAILVILQTVLICINLFYNSKDIEYILPLPVKPIELLISKFNVLLITIYVTELIFIAVPLIIYGTITNTNILYYIFMIIILVIFPVLPSLISCIVIMFFARFAKYFKNINRFQNVITILSTIIILSLSFITAKNINAENTVITDEIAIKTILQTNIFSENISKYFLTIKPTIFILTNSNIWISLLNLLKILLITFVSYIIFIVLGNRLYLKGILANLNKVKVFKKHKVIGYKKYRRHKVAKTYIKKEWRSIIRNPIFFSQCILPAIYMPTLLIGLAFAMYKSISTAIEDIINWDTFLSINIDINTICIVLGICLFSNLMSVTAVTSFSRDGKHACIIKYLPISLYRQFLYKSVPALILDIIPSIIIITMAYCILSNFTISIALFTLLITILINIFRIDLLQILDLKKPKLNWDAEYVLVRQNSNILISIGLLGMIILTLIYFAKVFARLSLINAMITIASILAIIIIIINIIVKKNEKELFNKII